MSFQKDKNHNSKDFPRHNDLYHQTMCLFAYIFILDTFKVFKDYVFIVIYKLFLFLIVLSLYKRDTINSNVFWISSRNAMHLVAEQ